MAETDLDLYTIAEIQLSYKPTVKSLLRPQITSAADAYELLMHHWDENRISLQEQGKVLLLNRANRVLGIYDGFTGGITGTVIDLRLVFAAAMKANACSILLAHNHPSENTQPSGTDRQLTDKAKRVGEFHDISVLDHIIVSPSGYYSFAEDGYFPNYQLRPS